MINKEEILRNSQSWGWVISPWACSFPRLPTEGGLRLFLHFIKKGASKISVFEMPVKERLLFPDWMSTYTAAVCVGSLCLSEQRRLGAKCCRWDICGMERFVVFPLDQVDSGKVASFCMNSEWKLRALQTQVGFHTGKRIWKVFCRTVIRERESTISFSIIQKGYNCTVQLKAS